MAIGKRVVGGRKSVEGGEREITACLCWLLQGKGAVFGMGGGGGLMMVGWRDVYV